MKQIISSLNENLKCLEKEFNQQFDELKSKLKFGKEYANFFIQGKKIRTEIQKLRNNLKELTASSKSKLESKKWFAEEREKRNKERELFLNNLLDVQIEIIRLGNTAERQERLTSLQNELSEVAIRHDHKEFKAELDNLCQVRKELTRLEIKLESLKAQQIAQIQVLPK